jgi:hypothetical protein
MRLERPTPGAYRIPPNTSLQRTACSGQNAGSFMRFVLLSCLYRSLWAAVEFGRWVAVAEAVLHSRNDTYYAR